MFDHISIGVRDLARARKFYDAVLAPLGYTCQSEAADVLGYGDASTTGFWVGQAGRPVPADRESGLHICFSAPSKQAVAAFHQAGIAAGGADNGAPGPRPEYGAHYYAAFLVDPEGYRLEAHYHDGLSDGDR